MVGEWDGEDGGEWKGLGDDVEQRREFAMIGREEPEGEERLESKLPELPTQLSGKGVHAGRDNVPQEARPCASARCG